MGIRSPTGRATRGAWWSSTRYTGRRGCLPCCETSSTSASAPANRAPGSCCSVPPPWTCCESLAGRIGYLELAPFDLCEVEIAARESATDPEAIQAAVAPPPRMPPAPPGRELHTHLHRAGHPEFRARIPAQTLRRFWTMLAHSQGGLLNAATLARNALPLSRPGGARSGCSPFPLSKEGEIARSPDTEIVARGTVPE